MSTAKPNCSKACLNGKHCMKTVSHFGIITFVRKGCFCLKGTIATDVGCRGKSNYYVYMCIICSPNCVYLSLRVVGVLL